jgi:hypothetical protein
MTLGLFSWLVTQMWPASPLALAMMDKKYPFVAAAQRPIGPLHARRGVLLWPPANASGPAHTGAHRDSGRPDPASAWASSPPWAFWWRPSVSPAADCPPVRSVFTYRPGPGRSARALGQSLRRALGPQSWWPTFPSVRCATSYPPPLSLLLNWDWPVGEVEGPAQKGTTRDARDDGQLRS